MDSDALLAVGITVVSLLVSAGIALFTIIVTVASIAIPFWLLLKLAQQNAAKEAKLLATGLVAPAVVLSAAETGVLVNHRPMVRIRLEVRPPGGTPFEASVDRLIGVLEAPRVQPGAQVEVRYEAENRRNLMIAGL